MKNYLFFFVAILIAIVISSCATATKSYLSFGDWDTSKDSKIGRSEFVYGYLASDYFDKWGDGKNSIAYKDLYKSVFESMDNNRNDTLSKAEFSPQIKVIYFGLFSDSFESWDDDSNENITHNEFDKHVSTSKLTSLWDTNEDKQIAEHEMAEGMFYICDANGDGEIDETELSDWKKNR